MIVPAVMASSCIVLVIRDTSNSSYILLVLMIVLAIYIPKSLSSCYFRQLKRGSNTWRKGTYMKKKFRI